MVDTSERGFNFTGNNVRVPVQCPICQNVTKVWSRNVSWLCPYCGRAYPDIERYVITSDKYRHWRQVVDAFSIDALQQELWALPEDMTVFRSNQIIDNMKRRKL
jgi:predicted RNA-binding Zn-ribbon protein involved in translation (DUF1610 family)